MALRNAYEIPSQQRKKKSVAKVVFRLKKKKVRGNKSHPSITKKTD